MTHSKQKNRGFTLVEVLVAMAITALVAVLSYSALSAAFSGAEAIKRATDRAQGVNQVLALLTRDIRQVVNRSVVDEFGTLAPALTGGELARELLSLTRAGWHNSTGAPRSTLQRVRWWLEEGALWRGYFPVLDRIQGTESVDALLLEDVERFELRFLPAVGAVQSDRDDVIDRRNWSESWVEDLSRPGQILSPPAAIEVTIEIIGLGEIRRTYVLPSYR